jgi:hypothetical protein
MVFAGRCKKRNRSSICRFAEGPVQRHLASRSSRATTRALVHSPLRVRTSNSFGPTCRRPLSTRSDAATLQSSRCSGCTRARFVNVLTAYQESCSICSLRHVQLLDAAPIIPDGEERGNAVVTNGLSLCKIHHAAFDTNILGIRPDYSIEIRDDILLEVDGPMLKHGLQAHHGGNFTYCDPQTNAPTERGLKFATSPSARRHSFETQGASLEREELGCPHIGFGETRPNGDAFVCVEQRSSTCRGQLSGGG